MPRAEVAQQLHEAADFVLVAVIEVVASAVHLVLRMRAGVAVRMRAGSQMEGPEIACVRREAAAEEPRQPVFLQVHAVLLVRKEAIPAARAQDEIGRAS